MKIAATALGMLLLAGALVFGGGFILMLLAGTIFAEFGVGAPIGFWPAVGLFWMLRVTFTMLSNGTSVRLNRDVE